MENYPEIQRRDGTLFFACPESDRAAIATSIERLIDMLDALEDDPDLEPYLAGYAADGGDDREGDLDSYEGDGNADHEPSCGWAACEASYGRYDAGQGDMEEEEEPSGFGDHEGMIEELTGEYELGWTDKIDQSAPHQHQAVWIHDGEPELGWCGHGIGHQEGESLEDTEANGDELDLNGDEHDYSGVEDDGFGSVDYDGTGVQIAEDMIRGLPIAARRAAAYAAMGARA